MSLPDTDELLMLSRDEVSAAFMAVLGRAPENDATIEYHARFPDLVALGHSLKASEEFARTQRLQEIRPPRPLWVNIELATGLRMWIDLQDDGVSMGCLAGDWEAAETELIVSLLGPGDAFLDIGANLGWYTLHAAQAVGATGKVHAIEPRTTTFQALQRSVVENGLATQCTLWKTAVGEASGRSTLAWIPSERNQGHTFLSTKTPSDKSETEHVDVRRLDDLGLPNGIRVIKIDVEGAEPAVLRGGMDLLKRDLPVIVAEVFPQSLRALGEDPDKFLNMLEPLGYTAHRITDQGIGRRITSCGQHLNNPYLYFSVAMIPEKDRSLLLDARQDDRVRDLERQVQQLSSRQTGSV